MNQIDEHLKDISEIRSMMERSSKFLSLSGLAGISAGMVALLGAGTTFFKIRANESLPTPENLLGFFILDAMIVLVAAIGLAIFFTMQLAKKKGLPVWDRTTKYILASLIVPLCAGGTFCMLLWYHGIVILIPPAMLIFYGLALLNTSKHTLEEVRFLAFVEIILGLLAMLLLDQWLVLWALGFGIAHIVYGAFMYRKYEQ